MNTIYAGPKEIEKVLSFMDRQREEVRKVLEGGGSVALHSHQELTEFNFSDNFAPLNDFRFEGWTFGVSVGRYPRKGK